MSGERYNDGAWHCLCAERRPTGLDLSIDNVAVIQKQVLHVMLQEDNFEGWIADIYARRNENALRLPSYED
ncbi:hypothetical protein CHARACLAT_013943 [Characodon lateralis]|uniref:Uncharacterized protein n=1 Tax=Characodon lateralis TaxID=208331 RepID=A0ABU7DKB1_9TELE|nr:hypothetical protein [Characodon lateralis]